MRLLLWLILLVFLFAVGYNFDNANVLGPVADFGMMIFVGAMCGKGFEAYLKEFGL